MRRGSVTLVGAGPGDPELLTLKAARAIGAATLLLVDDLVGDGVLALAAPGARIVHVGKRGGCRSTPQSFILRQMVQAARAGEVVVRLKGGDPFVFGRGGEELEHLQAAGIPVQVVNGITAGLAAASLAGVPLTHREQAQGVVFVTGHTRPDGAAVDWPALARLAHGSHLTLVIYMGVRNAAALQAALLQGLPAATSVAVVQDASLPGQRVLATTLERLQDDLIAQAIASPAILVVGQVARAAALASPGARCYAPPLASSINQSRSACTAGRSLPRRGATR